MIIYYSGGYSIWEISKDTIYIQGKIVSQDCYYYNIIVVVYMHMNEIVLQDWKFENIMDTSNS